MSAEGKAARWSVGRLGGANLAGIVLDIGGVAQTTVGQNRQHRDGAAKIVGHQQEPSGRMDAHIGGTGAAGTNGVEQLQFPVRPIDGEGTDRAFLVFAHPIRLIGGIQAGSGGIQSQAARARAHLVDAGGRHRPGGAIHLKEVNAATIAGRQIHLRWQHIAERRTEGSDIGDEWPGGFARLRLEQDIREDCRPRQCDRSFQKRTPGTVEWNHRLCLTISPGCYHRPFIRWKLMSSSRDQDRVSRELHEELRRPFFRGYPTVCPKSTRWSSRRLNFVGRASTGRSCGTRPPGRWRRRTGRRWPR